MTLSAMRMPLGGSSRMSNGDKRKSSDKLVNGDNRMSSDKLVNGEHMANGDKRASTATFGEPPMSGNYSPQQSRLSVGGERAGESRLSGNYSPQQSVAGQRPGESPMSGNYSAQQSRQSLGGERIRESSKWKDEGDCELVSSDNARFRVWSYHLQSSSPVFRDMLAQCGYNDKVIQFTEDIERSEVLRDYLRLVVHGKIAVGNKGFVVGDSSFMRKVDLLRFLLKYDCARDINVMLSYLLQSLYATIASPTFVFALGSIADDEGLCRDALALANQHARRLDIQWALPDEDYSIRPIDFGIAAWSVVPPAYQWALYKSETEVQAGKVDDATLCKAFAAALQEARDHDHGKKA